MALYIVSDDAPTNAIVAAGAGVYQSAWLTINRGVLLPPEEHTPPPGTGSASARTIAR